MNVPRLSSVLSFAKETPEMAHGLLAHLRDLAKDVGTNAINTLLERTISSDLTFDLLALANQGKQIDDPEVHSFLQEHNLPVIYFEMLQGEKIIDEFNPEDPKLKALCGTAYGKLSKGPRSKLIFAGEGSSREIPARLGVSIGTSSPQRSFEIVDGNCNDFQDINCFDVVVVTSNSGKTHTAIELAKKAKAAGAMVIGITAIADSELAKECGIENVIVLNCGKEKATGATKSVVEQALVMASITRNLTGAKASNYEKPALKLAFDSALNRDIPLGLTKTVSRAKRIVVAGSGGVHNELELKIAETVGKKVTTVDLASILHGSEETMDKDDCVIIFGPYKDQVPLIEKLIASRVPVIYVTYEYLEGVDPSRIINVYNVGQMQPLVHLAAGQNLLVRSAFYEGKTCEPKHARKAGHDTALTKTLPMVA